MQPTTLDLLEAYWRKQFAHGMDADAMKAAPQIILGLIQQNRQLEADLARLGVVADRQDVYMTPSELGQHLNPPQSARKVNQALADLGFQTKSGSKWYGSRAHQQHWVLVDISLEVGFDTRQLRWYSSVLVPMAEHLGATVLHPTAGGRMPAVD